MLIPRYCKLLILIAVFGGVSACSYLSYVQVQHDYAQLQKTEPAQKNLKHLIDEQTYYVVGSTLDKGCQCRELAIAIAAFTHRFQAFEQVDTMYFASSDTHFGLNLPEGDYELRAFADADRNGWFSAEEVVGATRLSLNALSVPQRVLSDVLIELKGDVPVEPIAAFAAPTESVLKTSLFYPGGTLRDLQDPIFDHGMAVLGMYDPAAFLEQAPTMFYALEEEQPYKVPVIFVHGIGGSARQFETIIQKLDRRLYKPWFFYYPSGGDLHQLAQLFHKIFISGEVITSEGIPFVIVAHSMGGLIVREAMNYYKPATNNNIRLIVSVATPYAGHPSAALGVKHGLLVLPAWRDLDPASQFIQELYRQALPASVTFDLLYSYANATMLKTGDNSDGVVPLSSQLRQEAQHEASEQFGFNASHAGVLQDDGFIESLIGRIEGVKTIFPEDHLEWIFRGGYDVEMKNYSAMTGYIIHQWGHYVTALATGLIQPFTASQQKFVAVLKEQQRASTETQKELVRFKHKHPELF